MLDVSGFELIDIYNELANYIISIMRSRAHSNANELPELIEMLIKLKQCIKEE